MPEILPHKESEDSEDLLEKRLKIEKELSDLVVHMNEGSDLIEEGLELLRHGEPVTSMVEELQRRKEHLLTLKDELEELAREMDNIMAGKERGRDVIRNN